MARIEAFRAWRPRPDIASEVASPPYDVLNSAEAREMAAENPNSFLHVNKPEIDLPEGTDPYDGAVYAKGAENLRRMVDERILIREHRPALYLYQQVMGEHRQIGLVAGASVDEYEAGLIKKHEHTRRKKEDDRTRHVDELDANTGPVFLTYKARPEVDDLVVRLTAGEATYDFTAPDGIRHTLWVVDQESDVLALIDLFAAVPELYVADGHHRSAAGTRIRALRREANPGHTGNEPYNFFLSVIFPDDQMLIMDYNRVVRDLKGLDKSAFLAAVRKVFDVTEMPQGKPKEAKEYSMYLGGQWYRLVAREGSYPADDPVRRLDVAILQDNLLAPVLGIGDPRADERVDFVGGIRGLEELVRLVDSGEFQVAFALHPTSIHDLFSVADAGEVMPPKSTWFEPKLRSGLIVRPLSK
ncbi:MAG: DUF1015 family protein [Thermoanaerobaculales bacterium]|nr:DUF1015 family protein [Thermoanaerobaculales bacterium]